MHIPDDLSSLCHERLLEVYKLIQNELQRRKAATPFLAKQTKEAKRAEKLAEGKLYFERMAGGEPIKAIATRVGFKTAGPICDRIYEFMRQFISFDEYMSERQLNPKWIALEKLAPLVLERIKQSNEV